MHVDYNRGVEPGTPFGWRDWARRQGAVASGPRLLDGAIVQRWSGTAPRMSKPPLDHHLIAFHLGGPKRVTRRGSSGERTTDVALHAFTTASAGSTYTWVTKGPIAFAHIYVRPDRFDAVAQDAHSARSGAFEDFLGVYDPTAAALLLALMRDQPEDEWRGAGEYYLDALLARLATLREPQAASRRTQHAVLQSRLVHRVEEYVRDHIGDPIDLQDLAAVAGLSRFHFARAFRAATGSTPGAFVARTRLDRAREMIIATRLSVKEIALACGFTSASQFSTRFRALYGAAPTALRNLSRP